MKAYFESWYSTTYQRISLLINLIKNLHDRAECAVRVNDQLTQWCRTTVGVRQGCIMSSNLFLLFLEHIMRGQKHVTGGLEGASVGYGSKRAEKYGMKVKRIYQNVYYMLYQSKTQMF